MLDAFLAVVRREEERTTETDGCGAETETFQDVGATTDAAVDEDFEFAEDGGTIELAFKEGHDRGW